MPSIAAMSLKSLAKALGGDVHGDQVLCPGPGHSPGDRSLSVWQDPNAPDGFTVHSHSPADDPLRCKDYVREMCGAEPFWSTDWFDDPDDQTRRLLDALDGLRARAEADARDYENVEDALAGQADPELINAASSIDSLRGQQVANVVALRVNTKPFNPGRASQSRSASSNHTFDRSAQPVTADDPAPSEPRHQLVEGRPYTVAVGFQEAAQPGMLLAAQPLKTEGSHDDLARPQPQQQGGPEPYPALGQVEHGRYVLADIAGCGHQADRSAFLDRHYNDKLRRMVAHVIAVEGPLYEDVLVARVARAHGFQRTGKHIGHRIKEAIGRRHKRTKDDGRTLVWPEHADPAGLVPYRFASEDVRAVDETPLAELATPASDALHRGATTEEAIRSLQELLGLSRLREATRCRLAAAVTLARNHFL